MERTNRWAMKITLGAAAAGLALLSLLPAARPRSVDDAARTLALGQADGRWVHEAAALARDPLAADRLGRLAEATNLPSTARGLVLDALAEAGTPEAQVAMQHALSARALAGDATYPLLVVRLGAVQAPTGGTLRFLADAHADALAADDRQLAAATASTLDAAYDHRLASLSAHRLHQARTPWARNR